MNQKPTQGYTPVRLFQIIWAALFASQLMYMGVLFGVVGRSADRASPRWFPDFGNSVELGMVIAAVSSAVACLLLPSFVAGKSKRSANSETIDIENKDLVPTRLFPAFVVRLATAEGVMLPGFALAFTSKTPELVFPFFGLAVILFLRNFPANPKKVATDLAP